ncbi:MAG TPA: hypothetical protein VFA92_18015 [Candidatus Binatia bacterium]|nr:hypothetical protein [Candidatus Binatia bacterium]
MTRALVSMPNDRPAPGVGDGLVLATRLALGLGEIAGETLADVVRTSLPQGATGPRGGLSRTALATASRARRAASPVTSRARGWLDPWYRRGAEEQRRNRALADAFWRALVTRITAAVVQEVDLDTIVDRIDLDRVIERVDVDAVVARVDFERVARQLLEQVDIDEIIRESTAGLADETVESLRVQGMNADRMVSRVVDRLMRRKAERQTGLDR